MVYHFSFLSSVWGYFIILCLGLTQTGALYRPIQPASMKDNTILSNMKSDLVSSFGPCNFLPLDVLSVNYESDVGLASFRFLEKCNVPLPKPEAHPDADVLLCMALYDIGLRICGARTMTDYTRITSKLPHNAKELEKLLSESTRPSSKPASADVLLNRRQSNLCPSLQTVLYEPTANQTKDWNLKATFQVKKNACDKICFDYDDSENQFCKLIYWGSNLLREAKSYQDNPVHNPTLAIDSKSGSTNIDNVNNNSDIVENPNGREIQIVESQSILNVASDDKANEKLNIGTGVYNHSTSSGKDQNIMKPGLHNENHHRLNEHQVADNKQKSSSTSSSGAGIDKLHIGLPENTQEQFNTNDGGRDDDINDSQKMPVSNSDTKSSFTEMDKQGEDITSPEKLSSDTRPITSLEKNVEGENGKTVQSSKTSADLQASKSSVYASSTTAESVGIGIVQESIQKPSELEDNNQEVGSEEFVNLDTPSDQGEDGGYDVNFPKTDLDEPEKTGTSGNNYFKAPRDEITNGNVYVRDRFEESEDSHFFGYFLTMLVFCVVGYLVFHNKQKILALAVEGRSRRSNRRRPNTANYHKLDSNLEEAVSSPCNTSVTHVIY